MRFPSWYCWRRNLYRQCLASDPAVELWEAPARRLRVLWTLEMLLAGLESKDMSIRCSLYPHLLHDQEYLTSEVCVCERALDMGLRAALRTSVSESVCDPSSSSPSSSSSMECLSLPSTLLCAPVLRTSFGKGERLL